MNTKKLFMLAGLGALGYYYYKKKNAGTEPTAPGPVSKLFSSIKENIKKPLDEVADDIPDPSPGR